MRLHLVALFGAFISMPPIALSATRVDYGRAGDLRNISSVFVSTENDDDLNVEARRQLATMVPALRVVPAQEQTGVTLSIKRSSTPRETAVTAEVIRTVGENTILYADGAATAIDVPTAVHDVVAPFADLLRGVAPERFGPAAAGAGPSVLRQRIHSTAGLRPGLSKRDVLGAFGSPTRVTSGSFGQTWTYKGDEGELRIVFGGDFLVAVTLPAKK